MQYVTMPKLNHPEQLEVIEDHSLLPTGRLKYFTLGLRKVSWYFSYYSVIHFCYKHLEYAD